MQLPLNFEGDVQAQESRFYKDGHTILWGDSLSIMADQIADRSINLIFADPPYNIGKNFAGFRDQWASDEAYVHWCYQWLDLCIAKLAPNGSMYIMASTQQMPDIDVYLRSKIHILSRIVWTYDSSGVQARKYFGSAYEPILFCVKNPKGNYSGVVFPLILAN